jgi:hypothetical protein
LRRSDKRRCKNLPVEGKVRKVGWVEEVWMGEEVLMGEEGKEQVYIRSEAREQDTYAFKSMAGN